MLVHLAWRLIPLAWPAVARLWEPKGQMSRLQDQEVSKSVLLNKFCLHLGWVHSICTYSRTSYTLQYAKVQRVPINWWLASCLPNEIKTKSNKNWVLVCWWWQFDCSFVRLISPDVTTTSIILSSNKIQNGDMLVPANPVSPGKWPLKWRVE